MSKDKREGAEGSGAQKMVNRCGRCKWSRTETRRKISEEKRVSHLGALLSRLTCNYFCRTSIEFFSYSRCATFLRSCPRCDDLRPQTSIFHLLASKPIFRVGLMNIPIFYTRVDNLAIREFRNSTKPGVVGDESSPVKEVSALKFKPWKVSTFHLLALRLRPKISTLRNVPQISILQPTFHLLASVPRLPTFSLRPKTSTSQPRLLRSRSFPNHILQRLRHRAGCRK
jgi:hypothetical protein